MSKEQIQPAPSADLQESFGERATSVNSLSSATGVQAPEGASQQRLTSYVFRQDRWAKGRSKEIAKKINGGEPGQPVTPITEEAASDFLIAAFSPMPRRNTDEILTAEAKTRREWMSSVSEELSTLRRVSVLDPDVAAMAAESLGNIYREYLKKIQEEPEEDPEESEQNSRDQISHLVGKARSQKDLNGAAAGVGPGVFGNIGGQAIADHFKKIRASKMLNAIFAEAGHMMTVARRKQQAKTLADSAYGGIHGSKLTRNLMELTELELGYLSGECGEELELLSLRRLASGSARGWKRRSWKPASAGPVIVCVDESGSMAGEKITKAKALVLALIWISRHQKRWIACFPFCAGSTTRRLVVNHTDKSQEKATEILNWTQAFMDGGTDMEVPMVVVPNDIENLIAEGMQRGKSDMILITDGQFPTHERLQEFLEFKRRNNMRVFTIIIEDKQFTPNGIPDSVREFSDKSWVLDSISPNSAPIGEILSI